MGGEAARVVLGINIPFKLITSRILKFCEWVDHEEEVEDEAGNG